MYMKEPEKCYRYNDAEDADFTKIVDPKHTALLMIDMQNDFCSPKGKFAQAGRAADSIIEIVPACRKLLEAARQANVFVVHIQQISARCIFEYKSRFDFAGQSYKERSVLRLYHRGLRFGHRHGGCVP